jgi:hypothetical protein
MFLLTPLNAVPTDIAGLIPQSLQLQAQVKLASLA